jgi:hypothetical protein
MTTAVGGEASPRVTNILLLTTLAITVAAVTDVVRRRPLDPAEAGAYLALFILLFALRVVGQVIVVLRAPAWLPPMTNENWNLVPYRILLPSQLAILVLMCFILQAVRFEVGTFGARQPALGIVLVAASAVYTLVMAARYVARMMRNPAARWFGGAIPIVFHMVLAAFLLTWGMYHHG